MMWRKVTPGTMFFPSPHTVDRDDPPNCMVLWNRSVWLIQGKDVREVGILYANGELCIETVMPDEPSDDGT